MRILYFKYVIIYILLFLCARVDRVNSKHVDFSGDLQKHVDFKNESRRFCKNVDFQKVGRRFFWKNTSTFPGTDFSGDFSGDFFTVCNVCKAPFELRRRFFN